METEKLRNIILRYPAKLLRELKDGDATDKMARHLWELASSSKESKEIRKAAKKALYTLRSSGVDVDIQKPQKQIQKKVDVSEEIEQALLSLPDSKDNSLLIVSTPNMKTMALDIHQILLHSRKGVLDYRVEGMSRRSYEKIRTGSEDFFPIPIPYALSRLHRALKLSSEHILKRIPQNLKEKKQEAPHPVLGLTGTQISRMQSLSDEKRVFAARELGRITLSDDVVKIFRDQIEEAKASRLIIGNMSPEQRVEGIIDRFCQTYFTEERRNMYSEFLFDIALYYHYNDKEHYVRTLVEYGKQLINSSTDIKAHPFVQFLIYKDILQRG